MQVSLMQDKEGQELVSSWGGHGAFGAGSQNQRQTQIRTPYRLAFKIYDTVMKNDPCYAYRMRCNLGEHAAREHTFYHTRESCGTKINLEWLRNTARTRSR